MNDKKLSVGDGIVAEPGSWSFGGDVCQTFDYHVQRSVPLYHETHSLIVDLAKHFIRDHGRVYDLGCSTGTLSRRLAEQYQHENISIVGVDSELEMQQLATDRSRNFQQIEYICEDVSTFSLQVADFVVCLYTLQFVPKKQRPVVIKRIYDALRPDGGFVFAEKVRRRDEQLDAMHRQLYYEFKRRQGYSDEEIRAKDRSLEGVLNPMFEDENRDMLSNAGFGRVDTLCQHSCFQVWFAVK